MFRVKLPLDVSDDSPEENEAGPLQSQPVKSGPGLKVLLAEDNAVNRMLFQKMLTKLGHQVYVAEDGREALAQLRKQTVDLVLMDCQMPELDGYQATRELRSWGGFYSTIPVIALTASALEEDRRQCIAAGMNDFLSKPVILSTLADTLTRWTEIASGPLQRL